MTLDFKEPESAHCPNCGTHMGAKIFRMIECSCSAIRHGYLYESGFQFVYALDDDRIYVYANLHGRNFYSIPGSILKREDLLMAEKLNLL